MQMWQIIISQINNKQLHAFYVTTNLVFELHAGYGMQRHGLY